MEKNHIPAGKPSSFNEDSCLAHFSYPEDDFQENDLFSKKVVAFLDHLLINKYRSIEESNLHFSATKCPIEIHSISNPK